MGPANNDFQPNKLNLASKYEKNAESCWESF